MRCVRLRITGGDAGHAIGIGVPLLLEEDRNVGFDYIAHDDVFDSLARGTHPR